MAEDEVVKFIAKFGLGFISDQLRDCATKKLQDGGLTYEKFKGYIKRELNEINSKLDGISRSELFASMSSLEQGVLRLQNVYLTGATSTETMPAQTSVTKECFKEAGIAARLAFHNTALSIKGRILASKVRMASTILENLDYPEVAASDCLLFLKELHAMPAIQEIFSVHIKGGIKSLFKKDSRLEAIETVRIMNLNLSDFITKFTGRRMAVFDWPMVYCDKLVVHPIHYDEVCFNEMKKMEITPPWEFDLLQKMLKRIAELREANASNNGIKSTLCCVPYGDDIESGLLKLQEPVDDMRELRLSPVNLHSSAHCVAVDENDYVYVLKVSLGYVFSHRFSVQIHSGNGLSVNDIRLKVPFADHLVYFFQGGTSDGSFYLGQLDEDGNLLFCFIGESDHFANLHDRDGDMVLSFPVILKASNERILDSKYKTASIPNEHFFQQSQHPNITEIAFVYTQDQLKGIVGLYPNCTDSPSESPLRLWDRYLPIIHVTAGGEILRCLHSGENLKVLFSRGF